MKERLGFVSNSSSASFIVYKKNLKASTINKIKNPKHFAEKLNQEKDYNFCTDNSWHIIEDDYLIEGQAIIDNYPINEYLEAIGLRKDIDFFYRRD